VSPELLAHGDELPPLTLARIFGVWVFDPVVVVGLLVVGGLYVAGLRRLRRRGDRWPAGRSVSFLAGGLGSIAVATMSSMGAYDDTLFSIHMVQHMVLTMVSPVFLALGAPVTLALRTLPGRPRRWVLAVLHSRAARVVAHPVVTLPLFIGTLYVLYFTPIYAATLRNDTLHELLHVHFLLAGCLFFWPLVSADPVPGRLPHFGRLLLVFVTLPVHAWLGIALMSATTPVAADYYRSLHLDWASPLADQHLGGGILWASGDLVGLLFFVTIMVQWMHADEREARRVDRVLDRALGSDTRFRTTGGTPADPDAADAAGPDAADPEPEEARALAAYKAMRR